MFLKQIFKSIYENIYIFEIGLRFIMKKGLFFLALMLLIIPFVSSAENEITLNNYHISFGDNFIVDADNVKYNDASFTGNAMIRFNGPEDEYTLLTHVFDGSFSYEASFCKSGCLLPDVQGNYTVSVVLLDSRLVELEEILVPQDLEVDGKLNIIVEMKNVQITPGDSIELEGSVQKSAGSQIIDGENVIILFEGVEYEAAISNKKFVYEFSTGGEIESNYHDIEFRVSDEYGNYGEYTEQFFVVAVPQSLSVNIDKEEYLPDENVQITVSLVDQAGEDVFEDVDLKIYNSKNKRVLKDIILSNEEFDFELDKHAHPGEWKIVTKASGLKIEKTFDVSEVEKIEVVLIGQNLEVINRGNTFYSKPLIITADNSTKIEKRTNLDPGKNMTIALYKDLDEGEHKLFIENTGENIKAEIIDNRAFGQKVGDFFTGVTGQAIGSSGTGTSNIPFLILVMLVVGMLVFISITIRKKRGGRGLGIKIKKPSFGSKKTSTGEDVEDIRRRILQDIKQSDVEKKKENSFAVSPIFKSGKSEKPSRVRFDEPMRRQEKQGKKPENNSNLFKLFD